MTYEEFLSEVKALKLKWSRPGGTAIRCENGDCPLIALVKAKGIKSRYGSPWRNGEFHYAGEVLGIGGQSSQIAAAADSVSMPLRKQMEEALLEQSGRCWNVHEAL